MPDSPDPQSRPVKTPGPDHPITVSPHPSRVVVTVAGRTVADTQRALALREARYPAVLYIPREDVDMTLLQRTDHATYCPYKGDCAYYSIPSGGARGQRGLDVRTSVSGCRSDSRTPRVLSRSRRFDRRQRGRPGLSVDGACVHAYLPLPRCDARCAATHRASRFRTAPRLICICGFVGWPPARADVSC